MARKPKTEEPLIEGEGMIEQEQGAVESPLKDYELWPVSVEYKKEQDEEFNVVTVPVFKKKGTEPLQTVSIEPRHAEILNSQSENSRQRYYPKTNA